MNDHGAYRDYLRPRGLTWIKTTLRVTVAVQCLGAAAQRLSTGTLSPVAEFLQANYEWSEAQVPQLDTAVAWVLLVSGLLTALRPAWPVLLPITIWFVAVALVPIVRNPGPVSTIELAEHGVRYLAPFALLILDFWPPKLQSHLGRTIAAMWILRLAGATTFVGLGLLAVVHSVKAGPSLDLLKSVADQMMREPLTDGAARCCLGALGGLSLGLAMNMLVTRSHPILVASIIWGFVSAFSRMAELGLAGYPETLVRFAEGGVPLVVLLYFSLSLREFPPEMLAEN